MTNDDGRQQVVLAHRVIVTPGTLALGLAWERCEKALPLRLVTIWRTPLAIEAKYHVEWESDDDGRIYSEGPTPADALNALADILEART